MSKLNSLMTIAKMSKCTKKSVNEKAFPCARTEAGQNKLKDLLKTNWIETWKQSPKTFCKKGLFKFFLRNSQENICARASNLLKFQTWSFIQKETSAQEFSYEFCEKVLRTSTNGSFWKCMRNSEQLKLLKDLTFMQMLTPSKYQHIVMISINSTDKLRFKQTCTRSSWWG